MTVVSMTLRYIGRDVHIQLEVHRGLWERAVMKKRVTTIICLVWNPVEHGCEIHGDWKNWGLSLLTPAISGPQMI